MSIEPIQSYASQSVSIPCTLVSVLASGFTIFPLSVCACAWRNDSPASTITSCPDFASVFVPIHLEPPIVASAPPTACGIQVIRWMFGCLWCRASPRLLRARLCDEKYTLWAGWVVGCVRSSFWWWWWLQ